jgi:hypothetical protein
MTVVNSIEEMEHGVVYLRADAPIDLDKHYRVGDRMLVAAGGNDEDVWFTAVPDEWFPLKTEDHVEEVDIPADGNIYVGVDEDGDDYMYYLKPNAVEDYLMVTSSWPHQGGWVKSIGTTAHTPVVAIRKWEN